jgi:hypothetical protein
MSETSHCLCSVSLFETMHPYLLGITKLEPCLPAQYARHGLHLSHLVLKIFTHVEG